MTLAADQLSKLLLVASLPPGESIPLLPPILYLTLVHNTGAAFGLFKGQQWLFILISLGVIGSPLEAQVTLTVTDPQLRQECEAHREALAEAFVVSDVQVAANGSGAAQAPSVAGLAGVTVVKAPGGKCQRCWKYLASVGAEPAHPQLCDRCVRAVQSQQG